MFWCNSVNCYTTSILWMGENDKKIYFWWIQTRNIPKEDAKLIQSSISRVHFFRCIFEGWCFDTFLWHFYVENFNDFICTEIRKGIRFSFLCIHIWTNAFTIHPQPYQCHLSFARKRKIKWAEVRQKIILLSVCISVCMRIRMKFIPSVEWFSKKHSFVFYGH